MNRKPHRPENRRGAPRYQLDGPIRVRMGGDIVEGISCCNISLGGLCLEIDSSCEPCRSGRLWLTRTYGTESINFESDFKKIWAEPSMGDNAGRRMGIMFDELSPIQRDNLWRIISLENRPSK